MADVVNRAPVDLAEEEFGAYDREALMESKMKADDWLSPQPY